MRKLLFCTTMILLTCFLSAGSVFAQTSPTPTPTPPSPTNTKETPTVSPNPSPTSSKISPTPTKIITITPTPLVTSAIQPTVTPSVTPIVSTIPGEQVSPTQTPQPTATPKSESSQTNATNIATTPTQTLTPTFAPLIFKTATVSAESRSLPPILKDLGHIIAFPVGFFFHESPQEFYSSENLSRKETIELLSIAIILFIIGMLSLHSSIFQTMYEKWSTTNMIKRGHHSVINV